MSIACLMYKELKRIPHQEPLYDVNRRLDVSACILDDVFCGGLSFNSIYNKPLFSDIFGGINFEENNYLKNNNNNEKIYCMELLNLKIADVAEAFNDEWAIEKLAYLEPLILNFLVMQIVDLSFKEGFVENVQWTVRKNRQLYRTGRKDTREVEVMREEEMDRRRGKRQ